MKKNHLFAMFSVAAVTVALSACGCGECSLPAVENNSAKTTYLPAVQYKTSMFVELDDTKVSVPDGLDIDANGDLILAIPNYIDYEKVGGAKMYKIDKNRQVSDWFSALTPHPVTGKVHPMGIAFGPDGHLYICDNQFFNGKDNLSRILRIVVENGKPVRCETVVSNFKFANGMRWYGNRLFVSNSKMDMPDQKHKSCVYAIGLDEMQKGEVKLTPGLKDKHVVAVFTAKGAPDAANETTGADGLTFDSQGRMYCGNFGDGVISRVTFDAKGKPVKQEVIIDNPQEITCCDGIIYDKVRDLIYITNSRRNAVQAYDVAKGTVQVISENGDTDGKNGELDQPCEPFIVDNQLIIVNFDRPNQPMKNTVHDTPITISVIELPPAK